VEALEQVESRVHTTPEQCLMSITTIARQTQGMHAGQVIAKLAEDAYFMRVNNSVTQAPPPPSGTASMTMKPQVIVQTLVTTVLERSYQLTPPYSGNSRWTLSWWRQRRRRPGDHPSPRSWRWRQRRREL
jgi:hypothetical protein